MFRSLLFVPGDRGDRFAKAIGSGADAVCIDLEDAVAADRKSAAREAAADFLVQGASPAVGVRINGIGSPGWEQDLLAARRAGYIMVPKVASASDVAAVQARVPGTPLWPLIESAKGLRHAWDIAAAPGVAGILFGAFDFSAEVGCDQSWDSLLFARSLVVAACAAAGVIPLEAPWGDLRDPDGLEESSSRSRRLGFVGRACIHPAQVEIVHRAYTPSPEDVAAAVRILQAFDGAAGQLDGRLIEEPVARAARRILSLART